jgi:uncharacterized protein
MSPFPVTLATSSILILVFLYLSFRVTQQRDASKIGVGTGDSSIGLGSEGSGSKLLIAVRAHTNFAEYVPLSLISIGFLEVSGASHLVIMGLCGTLILARLAHAIGMGRNAPNPFRFGGTALQWLVLGVCSIYGLVLVASHI